MHPLLETEFSGTVTWLGQVHDPDTSIVSRAAKQVFADFGGFAGDSHHGITRPACVRVRNLYSKGTEISNVRQLSVLSVEDLKKTASVMGLDEIKPEWLGVSMLIEGIPDFSLIPPSSRLQFSSGATLAVDMRNLPCKLPAAVIEKQHKGKGILFKAAIENRRGVTARVERQGEIVVGDTLRLFIPSQPDWPQIVKVTRR